MLRGAENWFYSKMINSWIPKTRNAILDKIMELDENGKSTAEKIQTISIAFGSACMISGFFLQSPLVCGSGFLLSVNSGIGWLQTRRIIEMKLKQEAGQDELDELNREREITLKKTGENLEKMDGGVVIAKEKLSEMQVPIDRIDEHVEAINEISKEALNSVRDINETAEINLELAEQIKQRLKSKKTTHLTERR